MRAILTGWLPEGENKAILGFLNGKEPSFYPVIPEKGAGGKGGSSTGGHRELELLTRSDEDLAIGLAHEQVYPRRIERFN